MTRDRDDLKKWEGQAVALAMQAIKNSYVAHGWPEIAPIDMGQLMKGLIDSISDSTFPAWNEMDPAAEPDDRSDEKYEDWREARGSYLR